MANYYVKKVRRGDDGKIKKFKTSKELQSKPKKSRKRKKVVKHVKKGKDIRTAYLDDGRWTEGDKVELHKGKWLKTSGNDKEEDNIGNLGKF